MPKIYETPSSGLCILHVQVESNTVEDLHVDLPDFVRVERRLQGSDDEKLYGAYSLSLIGGT